MNPNAAGTGPIGNLAKYACPLTAPAPRLPSSGPRALSTGQQNNGAGSLSGSRIHTQTRGSELAHRCNRPCDPVPRGVRKLQFTGEDDPHLTMAAKTPLVLSTVRKASPPPLASQEAQFNRLTILSAPDRPTNGPANREKNTRVQCSEMQRRASSDSVRSS